MKGLDMKHLIRPIPLVVLAAFILMVASPVRAQQGPRVAVANPARIFQQLQETHDIEEKLKADLANLQQEARRRQDDLKAKRDAREQVRPDSPEFHERNKEFIEASTEFEVWNKVVQLETERNRKLMIKRVYDKITEGVAEIAKQRGIDIVLAEINSELTKSIEQMTLQELQNSLSTRNILYAADAVDISQDVIALLDAKYRGGNAAPSNPPAP
jgi:Skp family chaperone for outer membrane proteins